MTRRSKRIMGVTACLLIVLAVRALMNAIDLGRLAHWQLYSQVAMKVVKDAWPNVPSAEALWIGQGTALPPPVDVSCFNRVGDVWIAQDPNAPIRAFAIGEINQGWSQVLAYTSKDEIRYLSAEEFAHVCDRHAK